jgi:hypothetical protein
MNWDNAIGAIAKHIPGTTTNRINKLNTLSANPEHISSIEQARIGVGHVLGRAAGGAVIGAGVNGYEYSQTGMGFGGSFSMTESVLSGAVAGAIGGGLVGSLGAKSAAKRAVGNAEQNTKKIGAITDKLTNNGRDEYRKLKTEARAAKKRFKKNPSQEAFDESYHATEDRRVSGTLISQTIDSYKNFNSSAQLNAQATKRMRTHIFSKPING